MNDEHTEGDVKNLLEKVINKEHLDSSPFGSMHSFLDFTVYVAIFAFGLYCTGIMAFVGYLLWY